MSKNPAEPQSRLGTSARVGGHREKNARTSRDRWITPREYALWTHVGLRGYRATREGPTASVAAGLPDPASRARNSARNVAFTDYLISAGLRLAEGSSLLEIEVPAAAGDKTPVIGKGGVRRHYRVMQPTALTHLHQYLVGERRDAVRRAQRAGRYDRITERLDVVEVLADRRGQRVRLDSGQVLVVSTLSANQRARLFLACDDGLQPAWLWLTESGIPMPAPSWDKVFDAANQRVSAARAGLSRLRQRHQRGPPIPAPVRGAERARGAA